MACTRTWPAPALASCCRTARAVTRDGPDAGQFLDRRPFLSRAELLADLRAKPPLEAGVQLKYSNHGYGLLGLMMEQVTGTDYAT